jgi:serine/threonine-protein kinase
MVSGRAPFIADDMGALFYQVINMDPHPLSKRVPDLPPGVEPVLRRALAKRISDRFPSIKDFSRAFEAAALGRQRELTPAPLMLADSPVVKGTVGYGQPSWPAQPAAAGSPEEMVATHRDGSDGLLDDLPRRRLKPVYLVAAAAIIVLIGVLLLWPRKAPPTALPVPAPSPAAIPVVNALPASAPAPVLPVAPVAPPLARVPKAKAAKSPTIDDLLKGATTAKPPAPDTLPKTTAKPTSGGKPSPFADPFESDDARSQRPDRPPAAKAAKPRPQRPIIEDL